MSPSLFAEPAPPSPTTAIVIHVPKPTPPRDGAMALRERAMRLADKARAREQITPAAPLTRVKKPPRKKSPVHKRPMTRAEAIGILLKMAEWEAEMAEYSVKAWHEAEDDDTERQHAKRVIERSNNAAALRFAAAELAGHERR